MNSESETAVLSQLEPGSSARVVSVNCQGPLRRRLMDMGMTPGVEIKVEGTAPLGDPMVLNVRGYRLGLRKDEAASIAVHPGQGGCHGHNHQCERGSRRNRNRNRNRNGQGLDQSPQEKDSFLQES